MMSLFSPLRYRMIGLVIPLAVLAGCRKPASLPPPPIAATNSFLQSAARDLLGPNVPVLCLTEPGMCPGHFDIPPSPVRQLRQGRLLLRMDFQAALDARLAAVAKGGLQIVPVSVSGGLCEPAVYLDACRQTAAALVAAELLPPSAAEKRLAQIARRMERLEAECRKTVAPWRGMPTLCSAHQEAFCRWLGLQVVATFRGADVESPRRLRDALQAAKEKKVRLIVANRPEGRRCADFLAEYLDASVTVFDNFPPDRPEGNAFDEMVRSNLAALQEAAR